MATLSDEDVKKLEVLTESIIANSELLKLPQLVSLKKLIEKFGGKIPISVSRPSDPKPEKMEDSAPQPEQSDKEESEMSDIPGINEGVIEGDVVADQTMGDSEKTPTEEEMDQAADYRSKAASAYSEQDYQQAIDLYTKAIELNPGNALYHAKRGQAFLKLQKPNACIRDCNKALEINPDSAASYKFRGRAHRLLGKWESAANDLRQACKLDFDEEGDEWLREVNPIAKKIEQHRIAKERKDAERARKKREKAAAAARKAREEAAKKQQEEPKAGGGGFPGGFNFGGGAGAGAGANFSMNDLLSGMSDPEVAEALNDIRSNPQNIGKYASNPKIAKLIDLVKNSFPGGMPGGMPGGFPGGMPGGFPGGMPAGFPNFTESPAAAAGDNQTSSEPKAEPKKPDYADDGLD